MGYSADVSSEDAEADEDKEAAAAVEGEGGCAALRQMQDESTMEEKQVLSTSFCIF